MPVCKICIQGNFSMIDKALLIDMMMRYINQNGLKDFMKLVLVAVEGTKD